MNNESITLMIYGGLTFILALGGVYCLRKGFQLIRENQGKAKEAASLKFLHVEITTGSIGAFVMATSFVWAWAAHKSLPQFDNGQTKITALEKQVKQERLKVKKLAEENDHIQREMGQVSVEMRQYIDQAKLNKANWTRLIEQVKQKPSLIENPQYKRKLEDISLKQQKDIDFLKNRFKDQ